MSIERLKAELTETDELFERNNSLKFKRNVKALVIDLENEKSEEAFVPQNLINNYIAGPALAARIWASYFAENESTDPIVIVSSPSAGKNLPMGDSLAIAFKSPQTGVLALNVCSSSFGARLNSCGYGVIILCNKMRRLGVVQISKEKTSFTLSDRFFGKKVSDCEKILNKNQSAIMTGPAADSHVVFSSAFTEGKITGRGGLGYVLGMKNVKAVIAESEIPETSKVYESFKALEERIEKSPVSEVLKKCGTSYVIKSAMAEGWAPVSNYSKRTDPRLFHLSGSEVERKWRYNTSEGLHIPGYEGLLMLGSNCDCFNFEKVVQRYTVCVELGLDPVSTGNILAFAKQSGKYKIDFSDDDKVLNLLYLITTKTSIGEELSKGAESIGAFHINGLECGAFDFRGSKVQALNSSMLWWFSNYFGLELGLCDRNPAFWQVFNEEIVMGLESFGFSSSILLTELGYLKPFSKFLSSHSRKFAESFFALKEVSSALSDVYECDISSEEVRKNGAKCRYLVNLINKNIKDIKPSLPSHFLTDPESNSQSPNIVNLNLLLDSYFQARDYSFAAKFSC